jgi:hypothetical protein
VSPTTPTPNVVEPKQFEDGVLDVGQLNVVGVTARRQLCGFDGGQLKYK